MLSEKEKKKREEEAKLIISSNRIGDTINSINYANSMNLKISTQNDNEQNFINKVNEANSIINSINPRQNVSMPTGSEEDRIKSQQNAQRFLDLIDGNTNNNEENISQKMDELWTDDVDIQEAENNQQLKLMSKEVEDGNISTKQDNKASEKQRNAVNLLINNKSLKTQNKENKQTENTKNMINTINSSKDTTLDSSQIRSLADMDAANRYKQISTLTKNIEEQASINLQVQDYIQQKETQIEAEKINKDLSNGNIVSSIWHIIKGLPTEAINAMEKMGTSLVNLLHNDTDKRSEKYVDGSEILTKKYQQTTAQIDNEFVKTASNVSGTIGQMVPSILSSLLVPGSGRIVQGLLVGTDAYQETLDENYANKDKALATAISKGALSYAVEGLAGGNYLGSGSLDDLAKRIISNKTKNKVTKWIASTIYEVGGEIAEEQIENNLDYIVDKVINNKNITAEEWLSEFDETNKVTFLTTLTLKLLGLGGGTYKEIVNDEYNSSIDRKTEEGINKALKIIDNENLSIKNPNVQGNTYIMSDIDEQGNLIGLTKTVGSEFQLSNKDININPAVVKHNVFYSIIDKNSGCKLDTSGYMSEQEAINGFNKKVRNADDTTITNINDSIMKSKLALINKIHAIESVYDINSIGKSIQQESEKVNNSQEQIKINSENFAKQVDDVIRGNFPQKDMLTLLSNTPKPLQDIGLPNFPITMTQKHLDTIMNKSGKYKNVNYHNLGENIIKQLPEAISNPLDIVKSNTKDDSIVLTTYLADENNNTVVAAIKIDGKGYVNNIIIDTNVMTSAYGKNNYEKFMEENLKNGNLLYDIDRGVIKKVDVARLQLPGNTNSEIANARFQLPRLSNSYINNSVTYNDQNVNKITTTNNNSYMQNKEKKYTQKQYDDIIKTINQISDKSLYNNGATINTLRTVSNNIYNVNLIEQSGNYYLNSLDENGQVTYQQKISNGPYSGKQIKGIVNNAIDNAYINITQTSSQENTANLQSKETSYISQNVQKIVESFSSQKEYTKNEMAKVWNEQINANDLDVSYDNNGNIQNYIAIEEDGDKIYTNLYDSNDNIVKSEVISSKNGKYTSEAIKNTIQKVTNVYDENRPIKGQSDVEDNGVRNLKKNKNPYPKQKQFNEIISNAINDKTAKGSMSIAKVTPKVADRIEKITGINTLNRQEKISASDIRHILNQHGNKNIETTKGQLAVTKSDIKKIPDVIENFDRIVKGSIHKDRNGEHQTVRFIKKYDNNALYVVEVVPNKGKTLTIKTMWKKPIGLNHGKNTLHHTSKTKTNVRKIHIY